MVCLSRLLQIVVKKGGETVWKEVSFNKLPKDQQNANLSRMPIYFLVLPFCAASLGYYAMAQYQFNPESWVAIQIGKIVDILFPSQSTKSPNPIISLKNNALTNYKEFIETEKAMRRPTEEVQMETKTEEQMRKEAEELWEQQRREELNEALNKKYTEYVKMMQK
ncbi:hypothetical protein niasHT_008083 [Heterodera trifolii]|uniref:Transmembrane protein n=1 Tax=Heterodera trifolii TaxID=157864 RepID=A0ABD2M062_9BILA